MSDRDPHAGDDREREPSGAGEPAPAPDGCSDLPPLPEGIDIPDSPGLLSDEENLRRLLHDAVGTIPVPDVSLDALRDGITARRRRRRQLLLSTVAAVGVLAIGTPAVLEATGNGVRRGNDQATGLAGEAAAEGGPAPSSGADGGPEAYDGLGEPPLGDPAYGSDDGAAHQPDGTGGAAAESGAPYDGRLTGADSPRCTAGQLGAASAVTEEPDALGKVYGTIRVANVSETPCRVTGDTDDLSVLPAATGTGGSGEVQIVPRTEDDRAIRLPGPEEAHSELVLPPGEAYEVRFAWVPGAGASRASCAVQPDPGGLSPDAGRGAEPLPDELEGGAGGAGGGDGAGPGDGDAGGGAQPGGAGDPGEGEPGGGDSGAAPTNGAGNGTPGNGGSDSAAGGSGPGSATTGPGTGPSPRPDEDTVVLRYTPPAGNAAVDIHLEGTCTGTVYRTGVLPSPSASSTPAP
ncbi:hypothetical protein GCM10009757_38610 [Streptomyces cheonanensis]|uniref:DUF4232 domain-containing protein n=1 Tax=Streptomyces cheonanensis TaxID=312720 RepID=A0ABN2VCJ2_9ACTN